LAKCAVCGVKKARRIPTPISHGAQAQCSFVDGEAAGCRCADSSGGGCVVGRWSEREKSVVSVPLGEWRFDRSNSYLLLDASGNGHHAPLLDGSTTDPTATTTADAMNNVTYTRFSGNRYVELGQPTEFDFGARDFAVEATIRIRSTAPMVIAAKRSLNASSSSSYWTVGFNNGKLNLQMSSVLLLTSTNQLDDSGWHNVRASRSAGQCELVVDQVSVGSTPCAEAIEPGLNLTLLAQVRSRRVC
jgi:hypothetical protein